MILISALNEPAAAISSSDQAATILDLLMKGGIIMIPIVLLSLVSFYIFIESGAGERVRYRHADVVGFKFP